MFSDADDGKKGFLQDAVQALADSHSICNTSWKCEICRVISAYNLLNVGWTAVKVTKRS
jgi:hypothetical protein